MADERTPLKAPTASGAAPKPALPQPAGKSIFFLSILGTLSAASISLFSMYGQTLQHNLGFSQVQVNSVSISSLLGMYLLMPVIGYLGDTYGSNYLALFAWIAFPASYSLASGIFARAAEWHRETGEALQSASPEMALCFFFIGAATSCMYYASLKASAHSMSVYYVEDGRLQTFTPGYAIWGPVAAFGLSSLWQSQLLRAVFISGKNVNVSGIFLFFAGLYAVVCGVIFLSCRRAETMAAELRKKAEASSECNCDGPGHEGATLAQFFTDKTAWLFLLCFVFIGGPFEMFQNNMGAILDTVAVADHEAPSFSTHVSLFATFSTISRLVVGFSSEAMESVVSRPVLLSAIALGAACIHLLVPSGIFTVYDNARYFSVVTVVNGFSYGSSFTLVPTIVTKVWGIANLGTIWGSFILALAVGSLGYGLLFAKVYDAASEVGVGSTTPVCSGVHCYGLTFVITGTGLAVAAAVVFFTWVFMWKRRGIHM
ncbi:putative transporter MCH1 [Yarrowia sp. B02]|nr:putative transporter MCH1 [Yarrowia sp. B02]